jgi:hypothetical protein
MRRKAWEFFLAAFLLLLPNIFGEYPHLPETAMFQQEAVLTFK